MEPIKTRRDLNRFIERARAEFNIRLSPAAREEREREQGAQRGLTMARRAPPAHESP